MLPAGNTKKFGIVCHYLGGHKESQGLAIWSIEFFIKKKLCKQDLQIYSGSAGMYAHSFKCFMILYLRIDAVKISSTLKIKTFGWLIGKVPFINSKIL